MALNLGNVQPPPSRGNTSDTTSSRNKPGRKPSAATAAKQAELASLKKQARSESVAGILQLVGGGMMMAGMHHDAAAVSKFAPMIGDGAASATEANDDFARVIDALENIGPYAELIMSIVPLALQIAVNHNRIPVEAVSKLGVVSPDVLMLELETKAALEEAAFAEAQAVAKKERDDALARLATVKAGDDASDTSAA